MQAQLGTLSPPGLSDKPSGIAYLLLHSPDVASGGVCVSLLSNTCAEAVLACLASEPCLTALPGSPSGKVLSQMSACGHVRPSASITTAGSAGDCRE